MSKTMDELEELADLNGLALESGSPRKLICEDHGIFWSVANVEDADVQPMYDKLKQHLENMHDQMIEPDELRSGGN